MLTLLPLLPLLPLLLPLLLHIRKTNGIIEPMWEAHSLRIGVGKALQGKVTVGLSFSSAKSFKFYLEQVRVAEISKDIR